MMERMSKYTNIIGRFRPIAGYLLSLAGFFIATEGQAGLEVSPVGQVFASILRLVDGRKNGT